jgi:RHS repeat-associated protein
MVQRGLVSITYDGDGNRVSESVAGMTTNSLVADVNPSGYAQVIDELRNGAVTRTYNYGLELINERQTIGGTAVTSFYGRDGLGSVRFLMDSTGAITDRYDFEAFGNLLTSAGSTPNLYLFAGQQFDPALGVYYNRARYLDVRTGRFFTQDTKAAQPADPATMHRYLYARANPVNRIDPSGLQDDLVELSVEEGVEETLDATELSSEGLQQLPNQIADELSATTEVEGDAIADAELEAEEAEAEVSQASEGEYVDEPSTTGRAAKYQEYATGRPQGQAYKLNGVKFDSFENGNLIDAKGPGYARLFQQSFAESVKSKLSQELLRQLGARAGARIIWRIAEEEAVPVFEEIIEEVGGSGIVDVVHFPAPFPL